MSNMSYCRFENTHRDLLDCQYALELLLDGQIGKLSDPELQAAKRLVRACFDIVQVITDQTGSDPDDEGAFSEVYDKADEILNYANDRSSDGPNE